MNARLLHSTDQDFIISLIRDVSVFYYLFNSLGRKTVYHAEKSYSQNNYIGILPFLPSLGKMLSEGNIGFLVIIMPVYLVMSKTIMFLTLIVR